MLNRDSKELSKVDAYFDSKNLSKDLGRKTARGGAVTMGAQGLRVVLQLGSTIALARLLAPEDFGLVGMVTVLMNLIAVFRDFGLTQATVQRPEITRQQISNLFWVNIGISVLIACIFALASPWIAKFYGRSELVAVTLFLSVGVFIEGAGLQHRALMMRAMQFSRLALADIGSQVLAVGIAVYLAFEGYGYWALVALSASGAIFSTVFLTLSTGWRPRLPRRNVGTLPFITYGINLFGFHIVNYFSRNADNLLIGKFLGAEPLGFYAYAYRLLLFPINQISGPLSKVIMSSLSRLQGNPKQFAAQYYQLMLGLTILTMPAASFVVFSAKHLVPALLGNGWGATVGILYALGPAALAGSINIAGGVVLITTGRSGRLFKLGMFNAAVTLGSFCVGINFGVIGVALAFSIVQIPMTIWSLHVAFLGTAISLRTLACKLSVPFFASIFSGLISLFLLGSIPTDSSWLLLFLNVFFFGIPYLAIISLKRNCREILLYTLQKIELPDFKKKHKK